MQTLGFAILFWMQLDWTRVRSVAQRASAGLDAKPEGLTGMTPLTVKWWTADG